MLPVLPPCADDPDPDDGFNYKQMMVRDERRFKMADKDGDLAATKEEFTAFLHPEEYDYMKDIVVQVGPAQRRFGGWSLRGRNCSRPSSRRHLLAGNHGGHRQERRWFH